MSFLVLQPSRWGKESWLLYFDCLLMSFDCLCSLALPRVAVGWSAERDCGIIWSYSLYHVKLLSSVLKFHTVSNVSRALL